MTELFLISLLSSHCCCTAPDSSSWLRYSDLVAFYRQYTSMDTEGIGYVLHSSLEAAMGPLLSCDSRLVQAMCFSHKGKHNKDDPTCGEKTVSLAVYINLMRILLKGSIAERATIAFRAFGGGSSNNNNSHFNAPSGGNEHDEAEDYVRSSDFKLIARDILFGLGFNPSKENEKIDDVVNSILLEAHGGGGSEIGASMSYPVFLLAYTLLVERLGLDAKREDGTARMCGVPPPLLLGFGTAQWVPLTYAMAGVEASVRAAMGGGGGGEKNTFDLSHGTPTIAGVVSIPQIGAVGAASKFLHKRIPALHGDRVTFADYAPATFAALRQRFGTDADTFLDAVGISALRAHLLLGRLYVPRDFRSSGRSGALLLSSHNHHFILKRISFAESRTLRRLLPAYVAHVHRHPHSLLQRFAGLYALTRGGEKSSFIIVENVFAEAQLPIAAVYDLKGSTVHRTTSAEERRSGAAGKDNDFLADKKQLHLSTEARDALLVQLEADTKLLEEANTLDYSLILGIHISDGGFASSKKSITLSTQQKQGMRELTVTLDEHRKQEAPDGPNNSVFRAYYGGVPSIDGTEVYYFGIVDCLTAYGLKKVGEHYGKSMLLHDMKEVSCVPPPDYRSRLMNFVRSILVE
ncbi:phosphatidylinositol-4-phosphate 5-Kinase [Trypanosoma grayi]|uniref:phosphatidylinositol-4-phosphate 5-Kinase n=1 Tax=Trypanosoma grayi TaxID=71804 RepID=UPI0004F419F2|nr:phosphatidylinositol-4-phosphate 5-Kinase [Trypanosoma grayi]KEG11433.1 phosphatidylinositol-4-phosphate 5-Kinase [Trypanosoma grayi]